MRKSGRFPMIAVAMLLLSAPTFAQVTQNGPVTIYTTERAPAIGGGIDFQNAKPMPELDPFHGTTGAWI